MHILNDLYNVYGDLLAKKGEEITPAVIKRIQKMGQKHKQVRVLLRNTDIFTDFENSFADTRYAVMFAPPVSKKEICDVAGRLKIENDIIFELANMKKNLPYTYIHVLVVAAFVIKLSLTYKKVKYDKEIVSHCGFTHDIGKTRIPISILNKKERLTEDELAIMKTHTILGYLLLNFYLKKDRIDCSLASLEHHEKLDGSGYPNGIKKISRYTQLISAVDIMDALMTKRPYREKTFSLRATLDYLLKEVKLNHLNKDIVMSLVSYARKDKPDIDSIKLSKEAREELPEDVKHEKYV